MVRNFHCIVLARRCLKSPGERFEKRNSGTTPGLVGRPIFCSLEKLNQQLEPRRPPYLLAGVVVLI